MNLSDYPDGTLFLRDGIFLGIKIGVAKIIWKHTTKGYETIAFSSTRFEDLPSSSHIQIKVLFKPNPK